VGTTWVPNVVGTRLGTKLALKPYENAVFGDITCPYLLGLEAFDRAHNPKVAGSNPAPATSTVDLSPGRSLCFKPWYYALFGCGRGFRSGS
jgi:hypothetical protein